jgi:hypothetical protein
MSGTIPPLPQYAFMAWCSVKAQGQFLIKKIPKPEIGTDEYYNFSDQFMQVLYI